MTELERLQDAHLRLLSAVQHLVAARRVFQLGGPNAGTEMVDSADLDRLDRILEEQVQLPHIQALIVERKAALTRRSADGTRRDALE